MPASLQQNDEIKYLKLSCTREVHSEPVFTAAYRKKTYTCLQEEEEEKDTKKKASDSLLNRRLSKKTAATYSPTVTQYHRRDEA